MVIVMQGISGSGKSTYAKKLLEQNPNGELVSADLYFMNGGEYKFDSSKLGEAHKSCMRNFLNLVIGYGIIIVDNTNTQLWEMAPYIQVGAAYGHEVRVVRCICPSAIAAGRNLHGVSEKVIMGMERRLEKPLPFWSCTFEEVVTF